MTKRAYLPIFLLAALLLCPLSAQAQNTLWDLLRIGDPEKPAALPPTLRQVALASQQKVQEPKIDPRTGQMNSAKPPAKRRTGMIGFFDNLGDAFRRIGKQTNSDLKVQGQHNLGFHMESISGSSESYQNAIYRGRRGLGGGYNNTDLTIQGKIGGIINFETRYSNSLYGNPYDNRLSLNYATSRFKIDAGDIQGSIVGNSLIDFSRTLKGIQLSADLFKGLRLTTLYSETKSQPRTITLEGANRSGPYYVYAGLIVDGSERVRVNNRDMVKGEDYTLDPYTGELNFLKGLIIHTFDTIAVTYETYDYNQTPGMLTGWRADMTMLKSFKLGATYLSQTSSANRRPERYKTEQFYGYNNPDTPYVLEFPVDAVLIKDADGKIIGITPKQPMTVTVGALPQVYGTDYALDPLRPNRLYFKLPIPSTQIIKVSYVPANTSEMPGDRNVLGMDASFLLGKTGTIVAEFASSGVSLADRNVSGRATQIRGDMAFLKNRLRWNWNLRDISPNFTAIESPGFRRNERGLTTSVDYQASSTLKLNANFERTKRPSYNFSSLGGSSSYATASGLDDYTGITFAVNWRLGSAGQLSFNHNEMTTRLYQGGKSSFLTDTLNFSYNYKSLGATVSVGRNASSSINTVGNNAGGTGTGTGTSYSYNSDSLLSRLNLTWRASDTVTFDALFSNSQVNMSGRRTNAQDMTFAAKLNPLKNLQLSLGYQLQDSGGVSLYGNTDNTGTGRSRQGIGTGLGTGLGTGPGSYANFGGGYNNNLGNFGNYSGGFYSGGSSFSSFGGSSFGGRSRAFNFALSYQPWNSLTLDLNYNNADSEGDYLYNSKRDDISFNIGYNMGERLSINTNFSLQNVRYIGSAGGTRSNLMSFYVRSKPVGRLSAIVSYQMMRTDSTIFTPRDSGTGTGTGTGDPYTGGNPFYNGGAFFGSGGTNLNSISLRLEYPVWRGNNLFFQLDNADSSGYLAGNQRTWMLGMDFPLTNNMRFTLGWRDQSYLSRDSSLGSNFSYRVRSLDADIGMRF
jgi:hypothetical protein